MIPPSSPGSSTQISAIDAGLGGMEEFGRISIGASHPDAIKPSSITSPITEIPANDAGSDGMMESGTIWEQSDDSKTPSRQTPRQRKTPRQGFPFRFNQLRGVAAFDSFFCQIAHIAGTTCLDNSGYLEPKRYPKTYQKPPFM
jgi:hypothetical protein